MPRKLPAETGCSPAPGPRCCLKPSQKRNRKYIYTEFYPLPYPSAFIVPDLGAFFFYHTRHCGEADERAATKKEEYRKDLRDGLDLFRIPLKAYKPDVAVPVQKRMRRLLKALRFPPWRCLPYPDTRYHKDPTRRRRLR